MGEPVIAITRNCFLNDALIKPIRAMTGANANRKPNKLIVK